MVSKANFCSFSSNVKVKIGTNLFNIVLDRNFFELNESFNIEKHNHAAHEIHFILSGTGILEIDGIKWDIYTGRYYLIGPGKYHEQKIESVNPIKKYSFRIEHMTLSEIEDFFPIEENTLLEEVFKNVVIYCSEITNNNLSIMSEIRNELQNKYIGYYSKVQSLFSQLLINIARDIASKEKKEYKILNKNKDFYWERNFIIEEFFEYNYNSSVTAFDLAKLLHISIRQLNRIMRDRFNMTFKQKIIEKRIEVSKNLLKNTELPVEVISDMVGYDTTSNFSTIFKLKTGYTPSEYRYNNKITKIRNYELR